MSAPIPLSILRRSMNRLVFRAEEDSPSPLASSASIVLRFQNERLLLLWGDLLPAPSCASLTLSFPATFWAEAKVFWLGIETASNEAATTTAYIELLIVASECEAHFPEHFNLPHSELSLSPPYSDANTSEISAPTCSRTDRSPRTLDFELVMAVDIVCVSSSVSLSDLVR